MGSWLGVILSGVNSNSESRITNLTVTYTNGVVLSISDGTALSAVWKELVGLLMIAKSLEAASATPPTEVEVDKLGAFLNKNEKDKKV